MLRLAHFLFFISLLNSAIYGQNQFSKITGKVLNEETEVVPGIIVTLENTSYGAVTNAHGEFEILDIPPGSYALSYSGLGYIRGTRKVQLKPYESFQTIITLHEDTQELNEIVILGKSQATQIREQAYAVEVVEAKGFKNLSINANDILGKISGVNIRQSGGLGSDFSLSLNGLSDNQVRIFLDGVPMDYFGTSLSLNNFSANLIERIEVYKGVVPIHLSSDALGGAINIQTGKQTKSYLDASYSLGSFGTHIGSVNAQYRSQKTGFTVRLKSFYNTSQNDYKVPIRLVDFENGGKEDDFATEVERFHDAYTSKMIWAEMGVIGTSYADQMMIGILYSDNFNEVQQPTNAIGEAKIPYGEVTTQEEKVITNLTYSKNGLLANKLSLNAYFVGAFSQRISQDTSSYRYDWFGNRKLRTDNATGEIENRKTFLILDTDNLLGNFNSEYLIHDNHSVALNYSLNYLKLEGSDDYKAQNNTQFSNPSKVTKQVLGANYTQTFLNKKLKNSLFSKVYQYHIESLETNYQGSDLSPFSESKSYLGFGLSSTYQFDKIQVKASYENAIRFPEIIELFGDGLNNTPNPTLTPEQSNNYNLGAIYNNRSAYYPLILSVNTFIRDAEDFIIPQVQGIKVFHVNNGKVLSTGVDLSASYSINNKLLLAMNGTYLDLRNNNKWRNGEVGIDNALYKVRVPNVPYLFGNLSVSYRKSQLLKDKDDFSVSVTQNYVHSFFYRWENIASQDKGIVPAQWTTNLELVYSLQDSKYNASFGVANLWDADVFDNYLQLRPGRTYSIKIRYFINQL